MLTLTRRDIEDAYRTVSETNRRIRDYQGKAEGGVGVVVRSLGVMAGAGAVGVLSGRFGSLRFADKGILSNVPLDAAAGLAIHAAGIFGVAGRHSEHLHNFADGVLAAYVTKFATGYGASLRQKANLPPIPVTAGAMGRVGPTDARQLPSAATNIHTTSDRPKPLSEAELAAMAQAARL
jgi:hypothetical protein